MSDTSTIGHNIKATQEKIKDYVHQYVDCDARSQEINDERADIREKVSDLGLDTKAFQDAVSRAKKDRKKKEGYDESMAVIKEALGEMDMDDLFAYIDEREEAKAAAKEEKKAAKAKEKEKDDEYKAAPDRKPKSGKSVGEQQAKAVLAAVH